MFRICWRLSILLACCPLLVSAAIDTKQRGNSPSTSQLSGPGARFICTTQRAGLIRDGRATLQEPITALSGFAGSVVLRLDLDGSMGGAEKETLIRHLGTALSIWYAACRRCTNANLTVIRVEDEVYLNERFASAIESGSNLRPPTGRRPIPGGPDPGDVITFSRMGRGIAVATFRRLSPHDPVVRRLASSDAEADSPLGIIKAHVERTIPIEQVETSLQLKLTRGTSCTDETAIACAAADRSIELNVRDYTFLPDPEVPGAPIGRGGRVVPLLHILVHEVGHWLGLPHLAESESIMAERFTQSVCINTPTIVALDSAVDLGWIRRLSGFGAFRPD